jgi:hypothetical protein
MNRTVILAALLASALTACPSPTPPVVASSVTVTAPAGNALKIGEAAQFTAAAKDSSGAALTRTFTWASSDPAVASVDANGSVTAKKFGTVNITATADTATGFSPIQKTYGLEATGGTYNRPYITPSADFDPISVAFFFRFRKADGSGPTATFNITLTGPSGWNKDAPVVLNDWGFGTPYYAWGNTDAKAVTGSYTLSSTIDGVTYSAAFAVDASDVLPATTVTPSAASATGATGTWTAVTGAAMYRIAIQDATTGNELNQRVYTTALTAAITGASMNTANPYRLVVNAYSFDSRDFLVGTSAPLPAKFNMSRNRANITF